MSFAKNVFVNCPFDTDYLPLLRPLLFTITYLGLTPRIAVETLNSGQARITKLIDLMCESKFAVHDLSRLKAKVVGEIYRMNMPFELGVDIGCQLFKAGKWTKKKCLILEAEKYAYQAAISDLSNSDIAVHKNEPLEVVTQVRNWLNNELDLDAPGPSAIWGAFNDFMAADYVALAAKKFSPADIAKLPIEELRKRMAKWVKTVSVPKS